MLTISVSRIGSASFPPTQYKLGVPDYIQIKGNIGATLHFHDKGIGLFHVIALPP